jgi:hypothetical protein
VQVFVLTTGRAGSVTFAAGCGHIENFTVAHESRIELIGEARFAYPDDHIEVDNRLSWFTGQLAERFPDARYVHLTRDESAVARSYARRWVTPAGRTLSAARAFRNRGTNAGLMRAFANGIVMRSTPWPASERDAVCAFMAQTVNATIREFLRSRPHVTVRLEHAVEDFGHFWDWIDARGSREAALAEWQIVRNASA